MSLESVNPAPFPSRAYRLVLQAEWEVIQRDGVYQGSDLDTRDGYLHMSPAREVRATAARYYAGCRDLVLLIIDLPLLGDNMRWDMVPSRYAARGASCTGSSDGGYYSGRLLLTPTQQGRTLSTPVQYKAAAQRNTSCGTYRHS